MRTIVFSGSSDDIFCYEEQGGGDEAYGNDDDIASYKVANDHGGLIVLGAYSKVGSNGCWAVGVTLLAEDERLPDWPISIGTAKNGYSAQLVIEVPDDVRVTPFKDD